MQRKNKTIMSKSKEQFEKLVEQYGRHFDDDKYVDIDYDYDYDAHKYDQQIDKLKTKLKKKK